MLHGSDILLHSGSDEGCQLAGYPARLPCGGFVADLAARGRERLPGAVQQGPILSYDTDYIYG